MEATSRDLLSFWKWYTGDVPQTFPAEGAINRLLGYMAPLQVGYAMVSWVRDGQAPVLPIFVHNVDEYYEEDLVVSAVEFLIVVRECYYPDAYYNYTDYNQGVSNATESNWLAEAKLKLVEWISANKSASLGARRAADRIGTDIRGGSRPTEFYPTIGDRS